MATTKLRVTRKQTRPPAGKRQATLEIWPESGLSLVSGYTWGHQA